MADDRTFEFEKDLQGLQGDAIIELFELDLQSSDFDTGIPDTDRYVYFCNWVVADGRPVQFAGEIYTAIPFKSSGFEVRSEGVLPNPTLTIANIGLEFTTLINTFDDLLGMKIVRRRVLARHLDNGSDPDAGARWPDETWFVQRKASEGKLSVTFELSTPFDLDGVTLPKRRALRYACPWVYRSADCSYTGPAVADAKDRPTTDPNYSGEDRCGKRINSCRLRFGGNSDLPYGGFPGLTL
jgi:lambda family phage minor tail protein L